jgi:hypothetical protein
MIVKILMLQLLNHRIQGGHYMSIANIVGLDQLKWNYGQQGREMGFDVRFFGRRVPAMSGDYPGLMA